MTLKNIRPKDDIPELMKAVKEKPRKKDSYFGLQLINTLAIQIDANYYYESFDQGSLFTLNFEKAVIKGIGNAQLG